MMSYFLVQITSGRIAKFRGHSKLTDSTSCAKPCCYLYGHAKSLRELNGNFSIRPVLQYVLEMLSRIALDLARTKPRNLRSCWSPQIVSSAVAVLRNVSITLSLLKSDT